MCYPLKSKVFTLFLMIWYSLVTSLYTYIYKRDINIYTYLYIRIHTYIYIHIDTRHNEFDIHIYMCEYVYMCINMCVYIYRHLCVYVYVLPPHIYSPSVLFLFYSYLILFRSIFTSCVYTHCISRCTTVSLESEYEIKGSPVIFLLLNSMDQK